MEVKFTTSHISEYQ